MAFGPTSLLLASIAAYHVAAAELHCRVLDPTGTPLNVRVVPGGNIVATLSNGTTVAVLSQSTHNGKAWVYIGTGKDEMPAGWVFRDYLACQSSG